MSFLREAGVLILTYNEAPNIERTLSKLGWARRILLIDSGSTDETIAVADRHPQVELRHRPFDNFASQCNFGLSQIDTPWVLSLDADYELSDALIDEFQQLAPQPGVAGYQAQFIYRIHGRALRGSLYPPRIVLYRREGASYVNEGHGHRVRVAGAVLPLHGPIYHDDRKPLGRWFASQQRYAEIEAPHLLNTARSELNAIDRLRRLAVPAPFLALLYVLVIKGCLLDGWAGWFYALQRMVAEAMIALEVLQHRLNRIRSN